MKRSRNTDGRDSVARSVRCAIYTRKSTEEGLDQEFNSLDAQREAAESYIASQQHEGWVCSPNHYDDGGYTGANTERPGLKRLFEDLEAGQIDCVVVYKVDRLSRSLLDFARMMETFEKHSVSFVSVTQHFNTTHSMGRLTLNILLSFAQFEREIISERTRDKIAAARRKGKWSGGIPILGYDIEPESRKLVVNSEEASQVRTIFDVYLEQESLIRASAELNERGWATKRWTTRKGKERGGLPFDKAILFRMLTNVLYRGKVRYKDEIHEGEHEAIVDEDIWTRVQQMLRSNGRTGGMHVRNKYGALLKGLLYCKPCARAMMHTYTDKGHRCYRYYVCLTAQKQGWDACSSKSIPAEQIEQFVVEQIRGIGKDSAVMATTLAQARAHAEEETASLKKDAGITEREIGRIHTEISEVSTDAATDGHAAIRLAQLHEKLREAEQELTGLQAQIEKTERGLVTKDEVDHALDAFDPLWGSLSPREQSRVLQLLIQRIEYDGAEGKVSVTFHADGIRTLVDRNPSDKTKEVACPTA